MIVLNPGLPQRPVTARAIRRGRFERNRTDLELLAVAYLVISQTLERAQIPLDLACTALEMVRDELEDARAELSLSWADENGFPNFRRSDQYAKNRKCNG